MNLLSKGEDKKKWIIGGSIALIVLIVVLVVLFWDKLPFTDKPDDDTEPDKTPHYIPSGINNYKPTSDDNGFVVDETKEYELPEDSVGVSEVLSYEDVGGYIELKVKGDDNKTYTYKLSHDTIVFDAKTKQVVLPYKVEGVKNLTFMTSTVKQIGVSGSSDKPEVLYTEDGSADLSSSHKLLNIVINEPKNFTYTALETLEKTEDNVYIINIAEKTRYKLSREARTVNALNGLELSENDLMFGDKFFIYTGDKVVKEYQFELEDDDFISKELVESIETKNGKNDEYFKLSKEEDLLSKGFKTIEVSEVYVYPNTASNVK